MNKSYIWKIALRNLFRNKRRTAATVSAIVTGFCGLSLLGGYIIRTEAYLRVNTIYINHIGHFSIYSPEGVDKFYINPKKYLLTNDNIKKITDILSKDEYKKDVEFVGKYLSGLGLISNGANSVPFMAKGLDSKSMSFVSKHPQVLKWTKDLSMDLQGSDFSKEIETNPETISVTKELGELLGLAKPFNLEPLEKRDVLLAGRTVYGDLNAVNAQITVSHTTGLSLAEHTGLLASFDLLQSLYNIEGASHLSIYLNESASTRNVMKKLNKELKKNNINVDLIPFNDERVGQFYVGTLDFLLIMAFFFVFLICSAVAISIVNAMTMGILERTKEIGTMRSLGLGQKLIVQIFEKEAILMTLAGVIIGTIVTQLIAMTVTAMNISFSPPGIAGTMQFILKPELWLCSIIAIVLLVVSSVSGKWVAKNKVKLNIVNLLSDAGR